MFVIWKCLLYVFILDKCFNFFRNMFYSKTFKIRNIIIISVQSNPMSSNIRVLIKIYCICPILYFSEIIWRKPPLNLRSFWYFCISKFVKGWGGIKNPFYYYFHNQLLQFLHQLYLFLYLFLLYISLVFYLSL